MPRFVIVSDTHCQHRKVVVPDGDIFVHCGDITGKGELGVLEDFCYWMKALPHKHKVVIMGNHEVGLEHSGTKRDEALEMLNASCSYLEDSSIVIEGLKIFGSPYTPRFFDWSFNADRGSVIRKHWDKIDDAVNVIITHGPPYGIMDEAPRGVFGFENVGCQDLLDRIKQLPDLKLHAFGHIHEGYGQQQIGNVRVVNASSCTGAYLPINPPVVIDL